MMRSTEHTLASNPVADQPKPSKSGAPDPAHAADAYGKYIVALLVSVACCFALYYAALLSLKATGNLPPPAFSNSLCTDEKLSFMREHPSSSPNLLAIGSSVALLHFDGATIARLAPGTRLLNGGFCGLSANQSVFAANWLLDRQPTIKHVVMLLAPQDIAGCRAKATQFFDRHDVDAFVYEGRSPWLYYMRYFAPRSLLRSAQTVKAQRANLIPFEPLVFDSYGAKPLATELTRDMSYGLPSAIEPQCLEAIRSLGQRLRSEGRRLTLVTTPLHPDWQAEVNQAGPYLKEFDQSLQALSQSIGARYWNAAAEWVTPRASFTDAIHLRWSAAQQFSAELSRQVLKERTATDQGTSQ